MAEQWERVLVDYFYAADRFGWPPTVVDEQPALVLDALLNVARGIDEYRQEQAERAQEG